MKKLILANWKANLAPERALQWVDLFAMAYTPRSEVEVILAVPTLILEQVARTTSRLAGVSLAVQSISAYPQGSYTGSTPAAWIRGPGRVFASRSPGTTSLFS